MSIEAIGAIVAIASLLVALGVIIARASGRLVAVETRVGDLVGDGGRLAALESRVGDVGDDVKELRTAIVSLSRPRSTLRESNGELLT